MKQNNKLNNIIFHVRYPYTALIIAIMWIGIATIIISQYKKDSELLLLATSICTIIIAIIGFKNTSK